MQDQKPDYSVYKHGVQIMNGYGCWLTAEQIQERKDAGYEVVQDTQPPEKVKKGR